MAQPETLTQKTAASLRPSQLISAIHLSIRAKLLVAFFIVIIMMGSINILLVVRALDYKHQYDALINNITTANNITGSIKPDIDTALWNVVKGKVSFNMGKQYQILAAVNDKIAAMNANTDSNEGRMKLEVIHRTMGTLANYVNLLGDQMKSGSKYDDNVKALDNIRGISSLVQESFQDYMLFEVNRTGIKYNETQASFMQWLFTSIAILAGVVLFSIITAFTISESIYIPIKKLHDVTSTITHQDLVVLASGSHADEITELGLSFNIMISKIRALLDETIKKQDDLKKAEMRVLQAQINPHFLYNTLDTIIWLAETNRNDQVVDMVRALSNFFRVTLSKGREWICIGDELEHVHSYLTILKVRYRDILDYQIDVDEDVLVGTILKLSLQPLVENALYHGIKNKRGGGTIVVRGRRVGDDLVLFEIEDNGIGVPPEKLEELRRGLANGVNANEIGENGYGIYNVNNRIQLFYGGSYGLTIESEYQKGTKVTVRLPYLTDGSGEKTS